MIQQQQQHNGKLLVSPSSGSKFNDYSSDRLDSNIILNSQMALQTNNILFNKQPEYRIVTSNSHIQILENGSMIIKEVDLNDATRYVCQAFNGINPSLSEIVDLTVLSKYNSQMGSLEPKASSLDP